MPRVVTAYQVGFLRKSRLLYDRYVRSVKPWAPSLWYQWLGIRPGLRIVDVGCGTGYFTRVLARGLKGSGQVIGVDNRELSLKAAEKETKLRHLSRLVEYRLGAATDLPLPDDYADVAVCRTLLMHLKVPSAGIREMCRVTKLGGIVGAIETDFRMRTYYSPNGEDQNRLARKVSEAWVKGLAKLDGRDYTIGSKLPTLFAKAGLVDIQLNLDADPWLNCDPRRLVRDKLVEARFSLERMLNFEEERKYLKAGGMSRREVETYRKKTVQTLKEMVGHPDMLARNTTFYGACWFIATGRKPKPHVKHSSKRRP